MPKLKIFHVTKRLRSKDGSCVSQSMRKVQSMESIDENSVIVPNDLNRNSSVTFVCGNETGKCVNIARVMSSRVPVRVHMILNGVRYNSMQDLLKACVGNPKYNDVLLPVKCKKDGEDGCVWLRWSIVRQLMTLRPNVPETFDDLISFRKVRRTVEKEEEEEEEEQDILGIQEFAPPQNARANVLDIGQEPTKVACVICMDDEESQLSCKCQICKVNVHVRCMKQYISSFYEMTRPQRFPCCLGDCKSRLSDTDIASCFQEDSDGYDAFNKTMIQYTSSVASTVNDQEILLSCYDCNTLLCMVSKTFVSNVRSFICQACEKKTCISCNRKFEEDGSCCDRVPDTDDGSMNEIQRTCQKCPGCSAPVFQIEGCNKMTCRCGTYFCFLCAKTLDLNDGLRGYSHFTRLGEKAKEGKCELYTNRGRVD